MPSAKMGHAVAVLLLLCLFAPISSSWPGDKIKLTKVQVLTLRRWHYTTARRSHPVPQLNCRGGSAGCRDQPSVVQCYNRGTDGVDVQWECKAAMKRSQKFGFIQVTCEGYDYPRDIYILVGSCGLEYYLEIAGRDGGSSYGTRGQHKWRGDHDSTITFPSFWDFVLIVLVAIVVYALVCWCFYLRAALGSNANEEHPASYAGQQEQTNRPATDRRSPSPPYNPYDTPPPYNPNYCSRSQRPSANHACAPERTRSSSEGPGFWTGVATGGLLGYMHGRSCNDAGRRYVHTAPVNVRLRTTSRVRSDTSSDESSDIDASDKSAVITSTGFGGTVRR